MSTLDLTPAQRRRRVVLRSGVFAALGLAVATVVVFLIGSERNSFSATTTYRASFANVEGLQVESPVRLGGLNVGRVTAVGFGDDLDDQRILVTLEVASRFQARVREDSVARVTSRGVLGDKAVDISTGSQSLPLVPEDGELKTGPSGDLNALLEKGTTILENATVISADLREGVAAFTAPKLREDVAAIIHTARGVTEELEHGSGTLHALIYDAALADEVKALVTKAVAVAARFDHAAARVDAVLAQVQRGDGTVHRLLYDPDLAQAVGDVGRAAAEVSTLIHDARTSPKGAVHQLVYGDASSLLADLGSAAADIKALTAKIRSGEGSVGAIINDPTIYEDLKEVLGNVKRNRVLRALVRLSVSKGDELQRAGQATR